MPAPTTVDIQQVVSQLQAVLTFAVSQWDIATIKSACDVMSQISNTETELQNELTAIAALPQPPPPPPPTN